MRGAQHLPLPGKAFAASPEADLLVGMLAAHFGGASPEITRRIDPARFLTLLRHHRVLGLIGPALIARRDLPAGLTEALQEARRRAALQTLILQAETLRVTSALEVAGIEAVVLKGLAFSQQFHGDPLARMSRDIDLLVRPAASAASQEVLRALGYDRSSSEQGTDKNAIEFSSPTARLPVELHVDLRDLYVRFPAEAVWRERLLVEVPSGHGMLTALRPEFAVSYAAYHASKHFWHRLFWLSDIAAAIRRDDIDWSAAWALSRRHGADRYLGLSFGLSEMLLGVTPPESCVRLARERRTALRRAAWIAPIVEGGAVTSSQAMARIGRFRSLRLVLGLVSGGRAKATTLRQLLAPGEADRVAAALPPGLRWAYFPLRLIRLLLRSATESTREGLRGLGGWRAK